MDMELQFPGDAEDTRAHSARNVSEAERWVSVAAGAGLVLVGLRKRSASGLAIAGMGGLLMHRGATGHCQTYEALGLNTAANGSDTRRVLRGRGGTLVDESVTVNRPAAELYAYWRQLDNLPRFMTHLESVEPTSDTVSRWTARGPAGMSVSWSAEIINEIPNELIAWRSLDGSAVVSAGSVRFDDAGAGRGT
ncbi:MAG: SRPBCC family protein, partial [Vicinamibacterales bacterium]